MQASPSFPRKHASAHTPSVPAASPGHPLGSGRASPDHPLGQGATLRGPIPWARGAPSPGPSPGPGDGGHPLPRGRAPSPVSGDGGSTGPGDGAPAPGDGCRMHWPRGWGRRGRGWRAGALAHMLKRTTHRVARCCFVSARHAPQRSARYITHTHSSSRACAVCACLYRQQRTQGCTHSTQTQARRSAALSTAQRYTHILCPAATTHAAPSGCQVLQQR